MQTHDLSTELATAGLQVIPLRAMTADLRPLTPAERSLIVDQAMLLIEEVFVHLPLKRAMHAVDPAQRLRLLRHRLETVDERRFHEEMISVFNSIRDLHTVYVLPAPYTSYVAILPFQIGEFFAGDSPRYVVTHVFDGLVHPTFKPGVLITHWNGVPIQRAIELHGRRGAGSNPAASYRRGVEQMTQRPLAVSLPPEEEWVELQYITQTGAADAVRLEWLALRSTPDAEEGGPVMSPTDARLRWMLAKGLDIQTQLANDAKKRLFAVDQVVFEEKVLEFLRSHPGEETGPGAPDFTKVSKLPQVFSFGTKKTTHGDRGYIRIATFMHQDIEGFVNEFVRILGLVPQNGLILDVRSNGGGVVLNGELLLQLFTDTRIEPAKLHFITSPLMKRLVKGVPDFGKWAPSMNRAITTGATYSQMLPLEDPDLYNTVGRRYPGKAVLLTNASCYSTTDIFAAGWQDHAIGPILGTDANTGAGGANVLEWPRLKELFDLFDPSEPVKQLPRQASYTVAIRATTRVRANAGVPLEDLGVEPDYIHRLALEDLIGDDGPLFDRAGELTK